MTPILTSLALAAEPAALAETHPFLDVSVLAASLGDLCAGAPVETDRSGEFADGACEGFLDTDAAILTVSWTAGVGALDNAATVDVETAQARDLALAEKLGFDPVEYGDVYTGEIIAEDEKDGLTSARSSLGTLTVIERSVDGLWVPAQRIAITRDPAGALVDITARWPAFTDATVVADRAKPLDREGYAAALGVDGSEFLRARAVLVPGAISGGAIEDAVVAEAVTFQVAGPDGSLARVGVYLVDGVPVKE